MISYDNCAISYENCAIIKLKKLFRVGGIFRVGRVTPIHFFFGGGALGTVLSRTVIV